MESIIYTSLNIGLEKPFKILQITDVHLTDTNEKDSPQLVELIKPRTQGFHRGGGFPPHTPNEYFEQAVQMAEDLDALLVITGDVMDLPTQGNIEEFHRIIDGVDCMFTPGGHDYQKRFVRTMEEPDHYWEGARDRLNEAFPQFDLDFSSRIVNGVNLVCINNSLDHYDQEALRRFREELEKGLPIVIFSHDPITCAALNCTEDPKIPYFTEEDYKIRHEMIDCIKNSPLVKGHFAGHFHTFTDTAVEGANFRSYVTPGLFAGVCRLIELK